MRPSRQDLPSPYSRRLYHRHQQQRWVDWEVDYAETCGDKEIIGVWAPGDGGCELPESLERHADAIVSWDADKIIDALNGDSCWEQPDGTPRGNQPVRRIGCR